MSSTTDTHTQHIHKYGLYVGIDGGGTKTHYYAAIQPADVPAEDRTVDTLQMLAQHTGAGTNFNSVGRETAALVLTADFELLLKISTEQMLTKMASGEYPPVSGEPFNYTSAEVVGVTLVMSGCNSDADGAMTHEWMSKATCAPTKVEVYNDSYGALFSGRCTDNAVACIAGTGMITVGLRDGKKHVCGGNGCPVDGGSAYAVGMDVVRACFSANDGMGQPTSMRDDVLAACGVQRVEQLIDWLYRDNHINVWADIARLAVIATKHALHSVTDQTDSRLINVSDVLAYDILCKHGDYLAHSIVTVIKQLHFDKSQPIPIVLSGGLWDNTIVHQRVIDSVRANTRHTALDFRRTVISAAAGAARHAYTNTT